MKKRHNALFSAASSIAAAAIIGLSGLAAAITPASAKEYLLTSVKPNTLVLADPAAREVVKTYEIPGEGSPIAIEASPDGKIAYVLTNHWGSISGIDLDTGEQVFRAELSEKDVRGRGMFAIAVSPDGKELYVIRSATELGLGEYKVRDPKVAVYNTADGLDAKPARFIDIPRRTVLIHLSTDGSKLYAVSWDIHVLDAKTGKELDVLPVANWGRENYAPPDVFGVWKQFEQTDIFVNPYFTLRTDMDPSNPDAWKTGLLTLDLETGEFNMDDFESTAAILFSSVVNPAKPNEVFSVYSQLSKTDIDKDELVKRVDLDHTYYTINISGDGKEVYVGGTMDDIGIYDSETLEKVGEIKIPGKADMGTSWMRIVNR